MDAGGVAPCCGCAVGGGVRTRPDSGSVLTRPWSAAWSMTGSLAVTLSRVAASAARDSVCSPVSTAAAPERLSRCSRGWLDDERGPADLGAPAGASAPGGLQQSEVEAY